MSYIITCNIGADALSILNLTDMKLKKCELNKGEKPFGPHELCGYKNTIITANSYNNTISIIDKESFEEIENIYVGAHPNDVICYEEKIYVVCGESDSIIVYNMEEHIIEYEIPVGICPHNISISSKNKSAFICNMYDDSISVLDLMRNKIINKIEVKCMPVKSIISKSENLLFVVASNMGMDIKGKVLIISLDDFRTLNEIEVGFGPVDIYEDDEVLYVTNFCDNSISVINLKNKREEKRYRINGMPRGIAVYEENIYVSDYLNGKLVVIDKNKAKNKIITLSSEPNAMILIKN